MTEARVAQSHVSVLDSRRPNRGAARALAVVFVTQLMLVVDGSIVNVALPDIQKELHFSAAGLSWVLTAYAVAFGGFILLSGRIGSITGARRALIAGVLAFVIASVVGGLAADPTVLIVARTAQGLAAALAAPSTLVLVVANTAEGRSRSRAMALFVLASGSGAAVGLLLGGYLTTNFGWRWVMFVNAPIGVAIVLGAIFFIREVERTKAKLDIAGAIISSLSMVGLVFGFTRAAESGWTDIQTLTAFGLSLVAIICLVLVERKQISPVVQLHYFSHITSAAPILALLLATACLNSFFYFAALFTQNVLGFNPLGSGLALLPFIGGLVITNEIAPRIIPRMGERLIGSLGLAGLAAGFVWAAQLGRSSTLLNGLLGPDLVLGIAAGLALAPLTGVIISLARPGETGGASSLVQGIQQIGGSIGVASLTTVFVAIGAASGEAHGISSAFLVAAAFPALGFVLFAIWGRPIASTTTLIEGEISDLNTATPTLRP